jgi:hypothetical protein
VSFAGYALGVARMGVAEHVRSVWQTIAFLGRYGHQSVEECLGLPVSDLCELSEEVGKLIRDEGEAMRAGIHD